MSNKKNKSFNKIKSLTLRNFEAYGDTPVTFKFSDINLIFGRNSSGKSSALQALKYFGSVLSGNEKNNPEYFDKLLNYQAKEPVISIRLEFYPDDNFKFFSELSKRSIYSNLFNRVPYIEIKIEKKDYGNRSHVRIKETNLGYDDVSLIICEISDNKDSEYGYVVSQNKYIKLNNEHPVYNDEIDVECLLKYGKSFVEEQSKLKMFDPNRINEKDILELIKMYVDFDKSIQFVASNSLNEHKKSFNFNGRRVSEDEIKKRHKDWKDKLLSDEFLANIIIPVNSYDFDVADITQAIPTLHDFVLFQKNISLFELCGNPELRKRYSTYHNANNKQENKQNGVYYFLLKPIEYLLNLINDVSENILSSIHIGPLRNQVQNITSFNKDKYSWYDGTAAYYAMLDKTKEVIESINDDLLMISENNAYKVSVDQYKLDDHNHPGESLKSLSLVLDSKRIHDFSQVGTGISQSLPIIVALKSEEKVLIIEQPELHLHPAATVELATMFIRALSNGNQIFIETHSEHVILRMLRHIREKTYFKRAEPLYPSHVSITYIDLINCRLVPVNLRTTEDGDFVERWPNGFFSERREELM